MKDKFNKVDEVIRIRESTTNKSRTQSGYKGVTIDKKHSKPFTSRFRIKNKGSEVSIYLGNYNTAEEAYLARIKFIDSLK